MYITLNTIDITGADVITVVIICNVIKDGESVFITPFLVHFILALSTTLYCHVRTYVLRWKQGLNSRWFAGAVQSAVCL